MFAKLRLLVWSGALVATATVLLHGAPWPDLSGDPAVATMATVRLVAGALAAYLLLATVIAVRLPGLSPRFARRMVATIAGTTLLLTPVAASAATKAPPPGVEAPVLHRIDAPSTTTSTLVSTASEPVPGPGAVQSDPTVVVQPGDHLWAIAERTMGERLGRAATDPEIVPFWTRLIDANRDRVFDPDVIFAGQELRLPS